MGGVTRGVGTRSTHEASDDAVALLRHDLRQVVAVILASVSAAEVDLNTCSEACRWLRHIADEARRISRICEHALRAGDAPLVLRSLDEVTYGVIDSIRVVASTAIDYRTSGQDITVDGAAMERALANVVENACRAAGPHGRVRIEINAARDGGATITVDDNGPGFRAFGVEGNSGLGLEVTRRVLDSLGGSLRISRRGPLGGARVQLDLASSSSRPTSEGAA
jgi:K+-sensing histidine kinase KdpD